MKKRKAKMKRRKVEIGKMKVEMKESKVEERDLISNLPDHLIVRILSCLQTKEAVKTSILSLRWKNIWKGINKISLMGYDSSPVNFANLVEHVLENCSSSNFLSFEFACPHYIGVSRLNEWIRKAITSKIENLNLGVISYITGLPALTQIPKCVLSSSSLVALRLHSLFDIQIPESIGCFPHLRLLKLDLILPIQCSIMHRLLSSCLVLETLYLSGHLDSGAFRKFDICVPTLEELSLRLEYQGDDEDEREYYITIDTPNLQYLYIMDDSLSHYVVKNLSRIHHVDIMYEATSLKSIMPKHVTNLLELLKGIAAAKILTLHFYTMDVLAVALDFAWPLLPNLVMLELFLHNKSGWTCFPNLLHSAPNLKILILDLDGMNNMAYLDDDDDDQHDNNIEHPPCIWTTPHTKPLCLLEYLKIIGVKCLQGNKSELQAVQYLLNNARVLDRMMINFHPHPVVERLKEKLLMLPRASRTCDVEVCERILFNTCHNDEINKI